MVICIEPLDEERQGGGRGQGGVLDTGGSWGQFVEPGQPQGLPYLQGKLGNAISPCAQEEEGTVFINS